MSFELLPTIYVWVALFAAVTLAAVTSLAVVTTSLVIENRSARRERGESIRAYYGKLHLAH